MLITVVDVEGLTGCEVVDAICFFLTVFNFQFIAGHKMPHFGELLFDNDTFKLKLMPKADEGQIKEKEKTKKIIDLKGNLKTIILFSGDSYRL